MLLELLPVGIMRFSPIKSPQWLFQLPCKVIVFLSVWATTTLAQVRPAESFTLTGQLSQPSRGKVRVLNQDSTQAYSAPIVGSRFVLKGKLAEPGLYLVQIDTNAHLYPVFLEGSPMQMTVQKNGTYQLNGSSLHHQWKSYTDFLDSTRNQLIRLYQARSLAKQQGDTVLFNQLWAENNSVSRSYFSYRSDLIARQPYTFFNLFLLEDAGQDDEYTVNMLNKYRPILGRYPTFQLLEEALKRRADERQKIAIGQQAYNFTLPDSTGATYSLASVRTAKKLILVDFWASWCGPCIMEFPNLKALHKKYATQGLEIIGISIDAQPTQWLGALTRLRPAGLQLILPDKIKSLVTRQYVVDAVPQTFLIDQKGIIRGYNLQGEELDKKIADLLAETR
ncbi:MAG: AhpC/TSA family protein [Pedobacter sp.]|nr:MAG: AhpC/TSA family protein [Pedobacter sp.]